MKILVYGINYHPEPIGVGKYTTEMCRYLIQAGHEVRVVTAPPYYPTWRVSKPYSAHTYSVEILDGVQVTRCPLYVPKTQGGLKRILHHLSFALASGPAIIARALTFRPDIVFAVAPSLMTAPAAVVAAKLCGAAKWLHIEDFEVDAAFDLGFLSGSKFKKSALSGERFFLRLFDIVSTLSPKMVELLRAKGVAYDRSVEFRNSADTSIIPPAGLENPMRKLLNVPDDAKVALYSGALGSKQALEYLVEAAQALADRRPDIVFVFCGAGSMKERLQENTKNLPNVRHLDLQPVERYGQLMAAADIHLLPQRPEVHDLMLPAKLPFMHATGQPVVAMAKPHTQLYAELDGAGVLIPPGDTAALIGAIVKLADDPELRASLGSEGRERGKERWDRNIIFRQAEARMYECCSWRHVAPRTESQSETI